MSRKLIAVILLLVFTGTNMDMGGQEGMEVVSSVDFARYTGRWYEIARLPNTFQKNCAGEVMADYALLEGKQLSVINQCRLNNGQLSKAEGRARLASEGGPTSKLKVRFAPAWLSWLPAVWGDYWVIDLEPDYGYAVVGTPDRKYLWVLSRSPQMEAETYSQIMRGAAGKGFDVSKLLTTKQGN